VFDDQAPNKARRPAARRPTPPTKGQLTLF